MLKKYYKYISINLLALAGYAAAFPWWHIFFIQRPESVRNDAINHSMALAGLSAKILFLYLFCLVSFFYIALYFFVEKHFQKSKECTITTTRDKVHFRLIFAGIVLFCTPLIPLTLLALLKIILNFIESLY